MKKTKVEKSVFKSVTFVEMIQFVTGKTVKQEIPPYSDSGEAYVDKPDYPVTGVEFTDGSAIFVQSRYERDYYDGIDPVDPYCWTTDKLTYQQN